MKSLLHVTSTWMLAQLIHPVLFLNFVSLIDGDPSLVPLARISLYSFIFSIPAYWLCLFFFRPIRLMQLPELAKVVLWKGLTALSIVISLFLVCAVFFSLEFFPTILFFAIPAIASSWFAILVRYQQFRLFDPFGKALDEDQTS